jgi:hypothetical protein
MSAGDQTRFSIWSPSERTTDLVLRVKRRGRGAEPGVLNVNGQAFAMTDDELPRDDWADVRRAVSLRAAWNDVEVRAAQQMEVLRLTGYSLTGADIPSDWTATYQDSYSTVLTPR